MADKKMEILSKEYVMEHGSPFDEDNFAFETYDKNYEQLFDKPMNEGGKPFNGLVYELYPDGELSGYTFYINGYQNGDDVTFYKSGALARYSRYTDSENFIYELYENGNIKMYKENHRSDVPHYYRIKEYDEKGRLTMQHIYCEIHYIHNYDMPDTSYNISWHDNGEFRKIVKSEPTRKDFYKSIEFDEQGYLANFEINPFYYPEYLTPQQLKKFYNLGFFDSGYRFDSDGTLLKKFSENSWYKYSGILAFLYKSEFPQNNYEIEKIMEFSYGKPSGGQYVYYKNGQIKENYCTSKGQEYCQHLYWYENGTMKEAVLYSYDRRHKCIIRFNENGELIGRTEV